MGGQAEKARRRHTTNNQLVQSKRGSKISHLQATIGQSGTLTEGTADTGGRTFQHVSNINDPERMVIGGNNRSLGHIQVWWALFVRKVRA